MLAPPKRHDELLPLGHPCRACEVRDQSVCGVLGCSDLEQFRNLGWTLKLAPGQTLFHEGDPVTRVFTVTRGALKLYKLLVDGRRQVTRFVHAGDFLGITAGDEHAFTAEALEAAQLCWFPRNRFDDFVEQHAPMERELYRIAAHELAVAQEQFVLLGRKTATERIASFLLALAGHPTTGDTVHLPMSRSDIADHLGLTKETVSRVLSALKRDGVVRLDALDQIRIVDRATLQLLAECAA